MSIRLTDKPSSILDQLKELHERRHANNQPGELPPLLKPLTDVFEKAAKPEPRAVDDEQVPASIQAGGLNISFQFDLFYELTSKVEAKMGIKGAERFVELSSTVSETFMGKFSLSIDAVGSFMNGTDKSLDLSPEVTSKFFDAVEGLADLSPQALENFLKETDNFFAELEKTYGPADGVFGQIKATMQEQAKNFFAQVENARQESLAGPTTPELPAIDQAPPAPEKDANQMIELLLQPGKKLGQNDYHSFLEEFWHYAEKMRQQMFSSLFNKQDSPYSKIGQNNEKPLPLPDYKINTEV